MRITPENVMLKLHNRSPQALAFLIHEYTDVVTALVSRILTGLGTPEDIEECVSDVFLEAWNRANEYDSARGTVRTWLLILTKYQALSRRRQLSRRMEVPPDADPLPDPVLEQVLSRERQETLVASIERLEPGVRAVMVCRYLLDMRIPDIANRLHLTRSQVDNRLSRGRQRLREQWDSMSTEEGDDSIGHIRSR